MNTFQERYCAARSCSAAEFASRLFWQCLHRHALPLALIRRDFFTPDRELIHFVGHARNLRELNDELRDFMLDSRNHTWWRCRAHLRISTRRLRHIARQYLPMAPRLPLEISRSRAA